MAAAKKKRVLIVDDERAMARALELKLNHAGFEAKAVFNGEEALAELSASPYDLMLLDLMMPKMDGFTVLGELKKRNIATRAIVASNLSQEDDEKKARALGAIDYFIKSNVPITEIVERVEKVLS